MRTRGVAHEQNDNPIQCPWFEKTEMDVIPVSCVYVQEKLQKNNPSSTLG